MGLAVDPGRVGDGVVGLARIRRAGAPGEHVDGVAFVEHGAHLLGHLVAIHRREVGAGQDGLHAYLAAVQDAGQLGEQDVSPAVDGRNTGVVEPDDQVGLPGSRRAVRVRQGVLAEGGASHQTQR